LSNRDPNPSATTPESSMIVHKESRDTRKRILCKNVSGEEIPPYSALEIEDSEDDGTSNVIQPSKHNLAYFLLSPGHPIPDDQLFEAFEDGYVLMNEEAPAAPDPYVAPTVGQSIGTIKDEWSMRNTGIGGIVKNSIEYIYDEGGDDEETRHRCRIQIGTGMVLLFETITNEATQEITASAVNQDGTLADDIVTFAVVQ